MLQRTLYRLGQIAMRAYVYTLLDMDVRYLAPLPIGSKVFAANHPTTLDPFLLLTITSEKISILVTEFCFKFPVFGRYLLDAGHIPVMHRHGRPAFDEAVQRLRASHTIGIFPEGALSPIGGGVSRAHTGVARLALAANVPIVPVGIAVQREHIHFRETHAGDEMMTARWYFGGKYVMTVGAPLTFDGDVNDHSYVRLVTDQIMRCIVDLSEQSASRLPLRQTAQVLASAP